MADPPRYPGDDTGTEPTGGSGKPRWMTAVWVVIAVLVFVVVAYLHLAGIVGPGAH